MAWYVTNSINKLNNNLHFYMNRWIRDGYLFVFAKTFICTYFKYFTSEYLHDELIKGKFSIGLRFIDEISSS